MDKGAQDANYLASCVHQSSGNLEIVDCTLNANSEKDCAYGLHMYTPSVTKVDNCNIETTSKEYQSAGVFLVKGTNTGKINISNCNIYSMAEMSKGLAAGVVNSQGVMTLSNCNIKAEDTNRGEARGIDNDATIILNDCIVIGTLTGVRNAGNIEINGGTCQGYLYGGAWLYGESKTSYIKNATIKQCDKPEIYLGELESINTGLYIGDSITNNEITAKNITVNMDNCNISGLTNSIKLRGSISNTLKISNSTIDINAPIAIDNTIHKLHIGAGCNFNSTNTNLPGSVVAETSSVYVK